MAETLADRMRAMAIAARGTVKSSREQKYDYEVTKLVEYVMKDAEQKMVERASQGCFTANLLNYLITACFYVKDDQVIIVDKFEQIEGIYMHRIYKIVHSDLFQRLIKKEIEKFGDMRVSCWYPGRNNINVITLKWNKPTEADDEKTEV
jgi:hypothetical protein